MFHNNSFKYDASVRGSPAATAGEHRHCGHCGRGRRRPWRRGGTCDVTCSKRAGHDGPKTPAPSLSPSLSRSLTPFLAPPSVPRGRACARSRRGPGPSL
eukprot:1198604-Rhodomonas_salina.1